MILDTNALSALADNHAGIKILARTLDEIAIPVIALGEFRFGLRRSKFRSQYEDWLKETLRVCRILVVDEDTASEYAIVREELRPKGRPIPSNDMWIAALARQHALSVVSRDGHFDSVPKVKRVSW